MISGVKSRDTLRPESCVFCRIIEGGSPAYVIYENDMAIAFLDTFPIVPGHTLIMPKVHISDMTDMPGELVASVFDIAKLISRSFYSMGYTAVNYIVNEGADAGQVIFHVHCHLIPRRQADGLDFRMSRARMPGDEMEATASRIRSEIKRAVSVGMPESDL